MIQKRYGVEMDVPDGKLPGFYAQIVHKIGAQVKVADRDQQLFILEQEDEQEKLISLLDSYHMTGDTFELWLLPPDANPDLLTDYGFVSVSGHSYLYAHLVELTRLDERAGTSRDRWAALQQMNEHILHSLPDGHEGPLHIVDKNHHDLLEGIARAYRVRLEWK